MIKFRSRVLFAVLALAALLAVSACGSTKDDESDSSSSSSEKSSGANPDAKLKTGPQDGLDPEAARQPV